MRTEEPSPPPSLSLCLPLWDTHIHTETRTHRVTCTLVHTQYYSGICLALWSALRWLEAGSTERSEGDTPHLFWMVSAGWPVIVCLHTASLSKSAPHYGRMETAVCWLAVLQEEGMCHMCVFLLVFFLWFYSTFFMEAVIVMVIHSWVAIVKSIPSTPSPPFHCWMH